MFTGLIESVGEVAHVTATTTGKRLALSTSLAGSLAPGDSLAVNGVCLTVVSSAVASTDDGIVHMDVSPETLRVTTLGGLAPRALVNLERPLRADGRVGGHFVQGHVDGTGAIEAIRPQGDCYRVTVGFPADLESYIVRKGSVAVDGISLTVADVDGLRFDVQIVPFTWQHTALNAARAGDRVNLETDILGKYVFRAMQIRETESRAPDAASNRSGEVHQ